MTGGYSSRKPTVTIVVTSYNHAVFLGDALDSIARQTTPAAEIIVIDDGSTDDPASVVVRHDGVQLIRQANAGLPAARNLGLAKATSDFVLFLDADDALESNAISASLQCFEDNPQAAMVYGGHFWADAQLRTITGPHYRAMGDEPLDQLLRGNCIGMHATVLYRRDLLSASGFDETLGACEDYDMYLRLARDHRVASHPATVARYRRHGVNMSGRPAMMLRWALHVHDSHRPRAGTALTAWRHGRASWKRLYATLAWNGYVEEQGKRTRRERWRAMRDVAKLAPVEAVAMPLVHAVRRHLPRRLKFHLANLIGRKRVPPIGSVKFGDLARAHPISSDFGFDRGTPVDRYYVEAFLQEHATDIQGRVLEIGDAYYSRKFGVGVTWQDVLHSKEGVAGTTIVGDLAQAGSLPAAAFDCLVITQTLQLIFDLRAAMREMARALRPGGVLLLTVPFISPIDGYEWSDQWYWGISPAALRMLAGETFAAVDIEVRAWGNVYAATCFLQGLALEEVRRDLLDVADVCLPIVVSLRARRAS